MMTLTTFEQAFSGVKRAAESAIKSIIAVIAVTLSIASIACEDAPPQPAPIAAATAVPTNTPAPPTPTAVPTRAPAPTTAWLPTALPKPTTPTATPIPPPAAPMSPTAVPPTAVPTSAPAPPTATPTSPTAAEARRIYDDAIAAMNALSSYRLRRDLIFHSGEMWKISIDIYNQPPDAEKWKTTTAGGRQKPVETGGVFIGGYMYVKPSVNLFHPDDPNRGKWIRGDEESETQAAFGFGPLSEIGVDAVVGTERLDGVETRRLTGVVYSNSIGLGVHNERMEVDIWVGVADGLIRRITVATAPDAFERVNTTMTFSDFNVPVAVEAPKDYIALDAGQLPNIPHYAAAEITTLSSGWTQAYLRDYGFSVSAPPDWDVSGSNDHPYNHPVPQSIVWDGARAWNKASELSAAMIQYVFPGQITAYEGDETHITVFNAAIIGTLGDAALSEYVDERLEHAEAALVIDGAIERRTETLPAGEAEVAEFAFRFSEVLGMELEDDTDYAQIQYFILSEGSAFILTFVTAADRIDAMRPEFAEIAQTARIEPRS